MNCFRVSEIMRTTRSRQPFCGVDDHASEGCESLTNRIELINQQIVSRIHRLATDIFVVTYFQEPLAKEE